MFGGVAAPPVSQLCGFRAQSVPIPALQFRGTPCGERVGNRADREPEGEGSWKEASRIPHHSGKLHTGREEQERQDEAQVVGDRPNPPGRGREVSVGGPLEQQDRLDPE